MVTDEMDKSRLLDKDRSLVRNGLRVLEADLWPAWLSCLRDPFEEVLGFRTDRRQSAQ